MEDARATNVLAPAISYYLAYRSSHIHATVLLILLEDYSYSSVLLLLSCFVVLHACLFALSSHILSEALEQGRLIKQPL
jgi:hypothetical protein